MIKIEKILFPTDFSACAGQALAHAIYLARKYSAQLHVLHGIALLQDDPYNPAAHVDAGKIHDRIRQLARDAITASLEPHGDVGVTVEERRGVAAADIILEYAQEQDPDLIVMGTHGRRGLGHMLLGSVAEEVVRMAGCPVLTVRQLKEPPAMEALQRILVPLDFSEHSSAALRHACAIAEAYQAELQLLHVVEQTLHPGFYATGVTSVLQLRPDVKERSVSEMQRLLEHWPGGAERASFHVIEGRAAQDVVEFARKHDSHLIVIATHGLTGIRQLLIGSVAEKVVRAAPCPVFTVKAFGKSLLANGE